MDRLAQLELIGVDSRAHGMANMPAATLLYLCACVRAADAMREHARYVEDMARLDADYDAARSQLEQSP